MKPHAALTTPLALALALTWNLSAAQADVVTGSTAPQPLILLQDQPEQQRPTIERLAREADERGVSLREALDDYAADVIAKTPSAQGEMPDGPVPDPTIKVDGIPFAELIDLNRYAESKKISFKEAIDRYAWSPAVNPLAAQLRAEFSEEVADIAIVDDGRGVRMGFKAEVPAKAIELAKSLPVKVSIYSGRGFSEKELLALKESSRKQLKASGKVDTLVGRVNAETGEVIFTVKLKEELAGKDSRSAAIESLQLPATANPATKVRLEFDDSFKLDFQDNYIRGGGRLNGSVSNCTNGFNVTNTSTNARGSLTARHCADSNPYFTYQNHPTQATSTTTLSRFFRATAYDLARYDKSATTAMTQTRTFYYDLNLARYAHDVGTSPVIGQPVCKYGRTTNADCDNITHTNVDISDVIDDGKDYLGNILTDSITEPGDSGGPWYYGNRAWGIHSAGGFNLSWGTWSAFVPADRVNDSGGLGSNWQIWTCSTC
ncbi:S1 family peptidase [Streptosporangium sp. NPDC002524]|uniref:S1 family peptidase n=1 Tax=Streptosporangium sp. NPDC002524 TaxID=3154537 RepID=UPI00332EB949